MRSVATVFLQPKQFPLLAPLSFTFGGSPPLASAGFANSQTTTNRFGQTAPYIFGNQQAFNIDASSIDSDDI